jgi:H+-transporting ATPase
MFDPFSPLTKKVTATVRVKASGETWLVAKGAPEIMNALPGIDADVEAKASEVVEEKSAIGFKTLGVCRTKLVGDAPDGTEEWEMVGYLCIEDPARHDSAHTIVEAQSRGVEVKMITGDQKLIAKKVANDLQLGKVIFGPEIWLPNNNAVEHAGGVGKLAEMANGFASVKPKHKHMIVSELQALGHTVGMTGDGVNDAPALKVANVGIAVADATDAARGAADIVLTKEGLSTIVTAINRSRMIFRRLESYIIYRLASSCFILGFFFVSITALKFDFPTWTLILLSIINDLTVMATSKDNVRTSAYPLYWDIPRISMLACVIGFVCILQSFLLLFFLQQGSYSSSSSQIEWLSVFGLHDLETCEIVAVMYVLCSIVLPFFLFVDLSLSLSLSLSV